ncbi:thioesterase [Pseudonocardia sulfidoxydans NBRC 16205]|uniref:Acyl-coenzyme A thioesterase THEM4 n=1 Tax=Pseudonocardia sulfidoxydans NBRC 16205 TaxID=1223511 RepID=A0A511DCH0_9PSEU|nr:thioesterase [Pseudonocardia sulfidoxydans NBRC 16205]
MGFVAHAAILPRGLPSAVPEATTATPTARPAAHPDAPVPGQHLGEHHAFCFACGHSVDGLRLDVVAADDLTLTCAFEITDAHQGAPGLVHGGIVAAAFDEMMGALQSFFREPAVTASLTTQYRKPIPVGATLHMRARVDSREGRKLWTSVEGRLDTPDGPVAADGTALFVFVPGEHFEAGRRKEVAAARPVREVGP